MYLVSFVFGFRYQISGKNKNKRFKSMVDLEPQQFFLCNSGPRSRGAKGAVASPIFLLIIIFLPQRE